MTQNESGNIKRFKSFDALYDFTGFCPDTSNSGETNHNRGITERRHKQLRSALIEAVWESIRVDPAMLTCYQILTKRMKSNQAIIRIARKLLRRIRAILLSGIPYQKRVMTLAVS